MAMQSRLVQAALGKQYAFGTPALTGKIRFGVLSGNVTMTEIDEPDLNPTWSTRLIEGFERLQVRPGADMEVVATRALIGQLLYAACGQDSVTGTAPYIHTIVEGDPLPYWTIFGRAAEQYYQVQDARCSTLELSFEKTSALKAKAKFDGCDLEVISPAWAAAADERVQDGYFNMGGGAFTIDGASANIQKGTIKIDNHIAPVAAAFQTTPIDQYPGMLTVEMGFTVIPDDIAHWRKVIFGSPTGTTGISSVPYYGSVYQKWLSGGTDTLEFTTDECKFMVAFPEAKAEGGPLELEIEAKLAVKVGGGDAFSWVLKNQTARYNLPTTSTGPTQ